MFKLASLFMVVGLSVFGCASPFDSSNESGVNGQGQETDDGCTYTQGYWKTHPEAWPVSSVQLGSVNYTKAQALAIFNQPVKGNGLIALAHQLLAAKLNVLSGASDSSIAAQIAAADALIGSLVVPPVGAGTLAPGATSSLVGALDSYNTGTTGPGHCGDVQLTCGDGSVNQASEQCDDGNNTNGDGCSATCQTEPPPPKCGDGAVNQASEQCDDGNNTGGDGCSATCQTEAPPPCCGDGHTDAGEQCDDGNVTSGDGCSATCQTEAPPPCCGDGHKDANEQCDDGNTTSGDGCSATCETEVVCDPTLL